MIKYIKKGMILTLALVAQSTIKADWYEWHRDPADKETHNSAELLAEQQIESDLTPQSQESNIKEEILKRKANIARRIKECLAAQYLSKTQEKKMAVALAHDDSLNLIVELTMQKTAAAITQAELNNQITITQSGKEHIVAKIKQEVIECLKRSHYYYNPGNVLRDFTKFNNTYEKTTKIDQLVSKEIARLPQNFYTTNFKPKHFTENDITEIYPKDKLEEMRIKRDQGKIWREKECAICLEDFNVLGKRVNLPCGHGNMCMKCASLNIHHNNDNRCPSCRAIFSKSDFSLEYLKENMNKYDLDIIKKLDPEAFKKISVLFSKIR